LERRGAQILSFRSTGGRIRLKEAFRALARRGVSRILVEGGGRTAAAVLEEKLADEAYVFLAPSFLGGVGAPTGVAGRGWPRPAAGPRLKDVGVNRLGDDVLIHGYF
jgi:diaminohydroxyphosphoribosylaminopyrimidine deaminase/5-amino-6-(5-phosphoribosylamino)uracil reductase